MEFPHKPRLLVAEDEKDSAAVLKEILETNGYEVTLASDGGETVEKITSSLATMAMTSASPSAEEAPGSNTDSNGVGAGVGYDLLILDIFMPHISGIEVLKKVKTDPRTRLLPVVMITGLGEEKDKLEAIEAGCDEFLSKPFNLAELLTRVRSLLKMKFALDSLDSAENVIFSLARAIEAKDAYTQGHTERVSKMAVMVGERLGLNPDDTDALKKGGILHDIGKIGVPDGILNKPGKLEPSEFEIIKTHPDIGARICSKLNSIRNAIPVIRYHHEKMDGSGYPDGLKGAAIPVPARIMAIVDVYDALTSTRPYRPAMPMERALAILNDEADRGWWDKEILVEFADIVNPVK